MNKSEYLPEISIVTVVFNGVNQIEKTIQSVVSQSYALQFVVVDGGSVDGTLDLIAKYDGSISNWISEKDNGIYDAMNKGVRLSSGEWICFLNCGDVFVHNDVVKNVAESIASNRYPDIIFGDIFKMKADGTFNLKVAKEPCNLHRMFFCHQASFSKKEKLVLFPFDVKHKMSADLKFFKMCYYNGCQFLHVNFPIVIYDTSGISNTSRNDGLKDNIAVVKEVDKGWDRLKFLFRLYFVLCLRTLQNKN